MSLKISVVIPTHNRPALVCEAVASVIAQTHDNWEALVVDDVSKPPLALAALPQPAPGAIGRVELIRRDGAGGPSAARNAGVERARGEVLTFLDDDDLLAPRALERLAARLQTLPALQSVWYGVETFGAHAAAVRENQQRALARLAERYAGALAVSHALDRQRLFTAMLHVLPMAFQRVAMRREMYARIGPFGGTGFGDLEWYYRVALRSESAFIDEALYLVRCDQQNQFSRPASRRGLIDSMIDSRLQMLRLPEVADEPALARSVRGSLAQAHFERAILALETGPTMAWRDLLQACRAGVGWPHMSLCLKMLARAAGLGAASRSRSR